MIDARFTANFVACMLQIALLAAGGSVLFPLLRLRDARMRLFYWQLLLGLCLVLPWLQPWRREVIMGVAQVDSAVTFTTRSITPRGFHISWLETLAILLALCTIFRLIWLAVGIFRLAAYRRRGDEITHIAAAGSGARLLISDDVASPVTFGWRDPVVLLAPDFLSLPAAMQEAILCHELTHVERNDWVFTLAEELVRSVLWFHPAIWWIIGEIQLAREQAVDRAVIETTQARDEYIDALLQVAGVQGPQADLAPAPMFLRRRHLKKRITEAMQEKNPAEITQARLVGSHATAFVAMAGICWAAISVFPLHAAPQIAMDSPGVGVDTNAALVHRTPVSYPSAALAEGIEGTVTVQVRLDANGEVADASIVNGPDALRKSVLQSVLTWHFDKSLALSTHTFSVQFTRPADPQAGTGQVTFTASGVAPLASPFAPVTIINRIEIQGLSDLASNELRTLLPVREGSLWTDQSLADLQKTATEFDSHLQVSLIHFAYNQVAVRISPAGLSMAAASAELATAKAELATAKTELATAANELSSLSSDVFSVGNGVLPPRIISKSNPEYPVGLRDLNGMVRLSTVVGIDGRAQETRVLGSFDSRFNESALAALSRWVFAPGTKNGVPVNVRATVEINFRSDGPPALSVPPPVRVGPNVQQMNLVSQARPVYPPSAKAARVQGTVRLETTIGKDGSVVDLKAIGGPPLLIQAAIDAVKQWVYKPTLLNGQPTEVLTEIDVNFTLSDAPQQDSPLAQPVPRQ